MEGHQTTDLRKQVASRKRRRRTSPVVYRVTTGSLSEHTKTTYQSHINDFLAHFSILDIEPLKEYSPKLIRQMILDYVIFLRDEKKVSRAFIKVQCAAISLFFYMIRDDDVRLDLRKVRLEFPPEENIHRDRAYRIEEIQRMLSDGCSGRLREKAIILLLTSTGMRIGGIHSLTVGDLSSKDTKQGKVYRIEVYSGSSSHYYCYCNVETAKMIDAYLAQRSAAGEVIGSNSPLFRDLRTLNVKNVKPLTSYNIKYIVGKVVARSGIKDTFQFTGEAKKSKGLRKFYKTTAELSGMKPINVELTHGHSIGTAGHYFRPIESEVLQDYANHAADALTIDPTQKLKEQVEQQTKESKTFLTKQKEQEAQTNQKIAALEAELAAKDMKAEKKFREFEKLKNDMYVVLGLLSEVGEGQSPYAKKKFQKRIIDELHLEVDKELQAEWYSDIADAANSD